MQGKEFNEKTITESKLGFVRTENMKEIEQFKKFIKKRYVKKCLTIN